MLNEWKIEVIIFTTDVFGILIYQLTKILEYLKFKRKNLFLNIFVGIIYYDLIFPSVISSH